MAQMTSLENSKSVNLLQGGAHGGRAKEKGLEWRSPNQILRCDDNESDNNDKVKLIPHFCRFTTRKIDITDDQNPSVMVKIRR